LGSYLCNQVSHIKKLMQIDELDKAYQKSIHFLKFRSRSCKEVKLFLKGKQISDETILKTIDRLKENGLLNDFEFASIWVKNRLRHRPRGIYALKYELKNKGVSETIIEQAVLGVDEKKAAWNAIKVKINKWEGYGKNTFRQKILQISLSRHAP